MTKWKCPSLSHSIKCLWIATASQKEHFMRNENEEIKLMTTKNTKKLQFRWSTEWFNFLQHTQKSNFSQIKSSGDELRLSELAFDLVFPSNQMLCVVCTECKIFIQTPTLFYAWRDVIVRNENFMSLRGQNRSPRWASERISTQKSNTSISTAEHFKVKCSDVFRSSLLLDLNLKFLVCYFFCMLIMKK